MDPTTFIEISAALQEQAYNMNKQFKHGSPIPEDEPPVVLDLTLCERELARFSSVGIREYFRVLGGLASALRYNNVPARVTLLSGDEIPDNRHKWMHIFRFEVFGDPEKVRAILYWSRTLPESLLSPLAEQLPEDPEAWSNTSSHPTA